jgi:hypothetical protein
MAKNVTMLGHKSVGLLSKRPRVTIDNGAGRLAKPDPYFKLEVGMNRRVESSTPPRCVTRNH